MDNEKKPQSNGEAKPHGSHHHHKRHKKKPYAPRPDAEAKQSVNEEKAIAPAARENAKEAQNAPHRSNKNRRRRGKGHKPQNSAEPALEATEVIVANEAETIDIDLIADESIYETPVMQKKEISEDEKLVEIIGIRFKAGGKTYYFEPNGITAPRGSYAIVETARGLEYGEVATPNSKVPEGETVPPLRPVIRLATEADKKHHAENKEKEEKAEKENID